MTMGNYDLCLIKMTKVVTSNSEDRKFRITCPNIIRVPQYSRNYSIGFKMRMVQGRKISRF